MLRDDKHQHFPMESFWVRLLHFSIIITILFVAINSIDIAYRNIITMNYQSIEDLFVEN